MNQDKPLSHQEVESAFEGWRWARGSLEPDGRVTVLYDPHTTVDGESRYLVRHNRQWFWTPDYADHEKRIARIDPDGTLDSWSEQISKASMGLRIPTADELRLGGFPVPGEGEQDDENEEHYPLQQIIDADEILDKPDSDLRDIMLAHGKLQASIASTMYELLGLLTEEFEYRRGRDELSDHPPVTVEEKEDAVSDEEESAHRSDGSGIGDSYAWAE